MFKTMYKLKTSFPPECSCINLLKWLPSPTPAILFIPWKGSSLLHISHPHWLGASSFTKCLQVELGQKKKKDVKSVFSSSSCLAQFKKKKKSTSRGRGRARGVDLREGARGGEEGEQWGTGERKPRGGGAHARTGKEAPRPPWWIAEVKASGWHYVNHRDSQAMRWWLQGARAVLCSPDARAPCYFFFPPTTLGVDSSWPWSLGRKKKILQEITSPSWTHIAQLAQQEGKQKKKRGRGEDVTCPSADPAPPWTPPDVFQLPFVRIRKAFGFIMHLGCALLSRAAPKGEKRTVSELIS